VTGAVTAESGATVAPGASPGILTINNNLTLQSGSTLSIELNGPTPGTGYDQVVVNGTVDVTGSTLAATLGFALGATDKLYIVVNDDLDVVMGRFNGLNDGDTITFPGGSTAQINYFGDFVGQTLSGGNDIVIHNFQPVPEPGTVLGVAALALGVAGGRNRRRQGRSPAY
jgi:hypothetical protein